jgi:hypothetical protein
MEQKERDKLLEEEPFFTANIPISMWKRDSDGKFYPVIAMPRKETCYNCFDEPLETEEDFQKYCDRAIAVYENAVKLFKLLKEHKIDHIYYFDSPEKYLKG